MSEVSAVHALLRQIKGLQSITINQLITLEWSTLELIFSSLFEAADLPDITAFINQRQVDRSIERSKPTPQSLAAARDREALYRKLFTELVHGHIQSINQSISRPIQFDANEPDILINQPKLSLKIIQSICHQLMGISEQVNQPVNRVASPTTAPVSTNSINQATNPAINQSSKQPTSQSTSQSITQSVSSRPSSEESKTGIKSKMPIKRAVNPSTSQPTNQPSSQSTSQPNGTTSRTGIPARQSIIKRPINQSVNPPPNQPHISALNYDPPARRSDLDQLSDARSTQSINQSSRLPNSSSTNQSINQSSRSTNSSTSQPTNQSTRHMSTNVKTLQEELMLERSKNQAITVQFHALEDSIQSVEIGGLSDSRAVTMLSSQINSLRRSQSISQSMYHLKRNVLAELASTIDVIKETEKSLRSQINQSNNQSNNQTVSAEDILAFRATMGAILQSINQCSSTMEDSIQRAHAMDLYTNNSINQSINHNDHSKRRTKAVVHTQEWQT